MKKYHIYLINVQCVKLWHVKYMDNATGDRLKLPCLKINTGEIWFGLFWLWQNLLLYQYWFPQLMTAYLMELNYLLTFNSILALRHGHRSEHYLIRWIKILGILHIIIIFKEYYSCNINVAKWFINCNGISIFSYAFENTLLTYTSTLLTNIDDDNRRWKQGKKYRWY
jgi:multisubunit Na+/H+ antiporter MnhE subunit